MVHKHFPVYRHIKILVKFGNTLINLVCYQLQNQAFELDIIQLKYSLLAITYEILRSIDNNKIFLLISLDFSKAFDTLNHETMLALLHYSSFNNDAVTLIISYVSDKQERVKIASNYPNYIALNGGVPHGSILGPLLFIIIVLVG